MNKFIVLVVGYVAGLMTGYATSPKSGKETVAEAKTKLNQALERIKKR